MRIYLGHISGQTKPEIFRAEKQPTEKTHGSQYAAVTGPFRTRRGAEFMQDYGYNNPHCRSVAEAEKLAEG